MPALPQQFYNVMALIKNCAVCGQEKPNHKIICQPCFDEHCTRVVDHNEKWPEHVIAKITLLARAEGLL